VDMGLDQAGHDDLPGCVDRALRDGSSPVSRR
jgi:hypothetical protein